MSLVRTLSICEVCAEERRYDVRPQWYRLLEAALEGAGRVLVVTSRLRARGARRNHGVENGSCLKVVGDRLGRDEQTVLPARMRGERPMYARRWA